MKLDASGTKVWQTEIGNYPGGINQYAGLTQGDWALVYTECWGIAKTYAPTAYNTHDGYIMACGTGIENCDGATFSTELNTECKADVRTTWRALTVAVNLNGERVWSRMDSYQGGEATVGSSASEYIFEAASGKSTMVTDEGFGFGIATFNAYDTYLCGTNTSTTTNTDSSSTNTTSPTSAARLASAAALAFIGLVAAQ